MTKPVYPLLCGFSETVVCTGFVAHVSADGRAIAVAEPNDGWWFYGVNPGSLSAGGATVREAHYAFLEAFRLVLYDIANDSSDFASFQRKVEEFFNEVPASTVSEWESAVQRVRSEQITLDDLPRASADRKSSINVVLLRDLMPSDNRIEKPPAIAA